MPNNRSADETDASESGGKRTLTLLRTFVPGQILEVTMRCFQSRFLLLPQEGLEAIFLGVLGKAQQLYNMKICYFVALSNHVHLHLLPEDKDQLENFQRYLACNLSREVGRSFQWSGGIFRHRYSSVPVTDEPEAEAERLGYLLAQGMKESICPNPVDWLGPHAVKSLIRGEFTVLGGIWTDRTRECEEWREYRRFRKAKTPRVRRKKPRRSDFKQPVVVELTKIPSWSQLSDEQYAEAVRDMLEAKKKEHAEEIAKVPEHWRDRVLGLDPCSSPEKTARRPKPFCHAATREARQAFKAQLKASINAFAEASARFRQGVLEALAEFPENFYPPRVLRVPDLPAVSLPPVPDTS